ncbi:TIGR02646 family protein [Enterococcus hulanensis]|uniref:retron system putative HNH endonuclease n=1 Tax=Enterococcus hulanensis TaxID=2559929 RepID=UPI001A9394C5|nr:retron system putative HNH endonuclease [Enterococcus hulanensis]MBO0409430.1 TIGR02646 family protein [Enterococcus hulanensis]
MLKVDKERIPDLYKDKNFLKYLNAEDTKTRRKGYEKYRNEIVEALIKETDNRCTYCEQKLGITSTHTIDHFYPKSIYEDKILEWNNLFLCCSVCNYSKGGKDPKDILNPAEDDVKNLLKLNENGELYSEESTKAKKTIEMFNLNRTDLVSMRLYEKLRNNPEHDSDFYKFTLKFRRDQNNMRIKRVLINDVPSECDLLDRAEDAKVLSDSITEMKSDEPVVVGIFGEWGEGKSSFMNLIETNLDFNDKVKCIRFNASEYDDKESIWYSLLNSILNKYGDKATNRIRYYVCSISDNKQIKDIVKRIPLLLLFCLILYFVKTKVIDNYASFSLIENIMFFIASIIPITNFILPKSIKLYMSSFKNEFFNSITYPDYTEKLGDREFIKKQLEIVKKVSKDNKIVVFIDELDRCSEKTISSFFKAIEVFLPIKGFIYVVGINPNVVYPAVAKANSFLYETDIDFLSLKKEGKKYIEKYITIPVSLSTPINYDNFIQSIYDNTEISDEDNVDSSKNDSEISDEETKFNSDDLQGYAKLINMINTDKNVYPRDIKRLLGTLEMKNKRLYLIPERELTTLIIMNYFYPEFLNFFDKKYFDIHRKLDVNDYFNKSGQKKMDLFSSFSKVVISENKKEISAIVNRYLNEMPINDYLSILKDIVSLSNNI